MGDKGRITILAIFVSIIAFSMVFLGFMGMYGDMAQKHGVYHEGEQNLSPKIHELKDRAESFSETQKEQTQGLQAGAGNIFVNAITGSLGVVKGFFNIIGMLFLIIPALSQSLHMPGWVGELINAVVIFTITYLVIKFLFGGNT